MHSRTMFPAPHQKCPKADLIKVQEPSQQFTEVCDTVTESSCSWFTEGDQDTEPHKDGYCEDHKNTESEKAPSDTAQCVRAITSYNVTFSREVEHNFAILRKLLLATPEEVALKMLPLSNSETIGRTSKKTLFLDLDDTLVHTINPYFDYTSLNVAHTDVKTVLYQDSTTSEIFSIKVVVRPYAVQFLRELSSVYEIVVCFFNHHVFIDFHGFTEVICQCSAQLA